MTFMANLVAIVGRPNVGKSTLFNRLTQSRRAIVSDTAGTTRDRQYGKCSWNGREFSVVDTGGWVVKSDDIFEDAIRKQVLVATEEADLVLFLVDVNTGLTDWDEDVALILRRAKLPVILVANKVDNSAEYYQAAEFYKLGLGDPQCISAATGGGTGDLLDMILDKLQDNSEESIDEDIPRFAVVGRPNAGKSSIINAFIGEDRNIVTEIAGTTRDSIYTRYDKFGFDFYLVDTAGIRRKNKVSEDLEFYSVMRSIRAIENSDVCILMLDATRGIETQDMNIFQLIQKNNKSLVVVVNKWDLVEEKNQKVIDTFENAIRKRMAPFVDFPIIFASALTKQRIFRVLETAKQVYQNRKVHIGTSKLNEVMLPIIEAFPPQSVKGKCISAATGGGTGDLLDMILDKLQDNSEESIDEDIPRFAVVGRPNAGKSSIINAFIGEDRNIVTEIAGTTRDSIYTRYDKFGFDFYLVDTAGIRRKNKVSEDLEFYSVMRSIRAIENSDVCILMLDATRGIETQDMNIFQLIQKNNKSLVVVVNKWDLVEEKNQKVIDTFENAIRKRMAPFVDFPIIFASALTKQRIFRVLETAKQVYQNRKVHIGTSKLNEVMLPIIEAFPPQSVKGKYIKIKYCTQLPNTTIPSFVFYANLPQYVKENYRRFLENKIRENWSLHGCPINVFIRQK